MSFRRHLLKMPLDKFIKNHLICWYSPKKQGATNESLAADPRLIDLSGNDRDCEIGAVNFTNLLSDDYGLVISKYSVSCNTSFSVAEGFTIILNRTLTTDERGGCVELANTYTADNTICLEYCYETRNYVRVLKNIFRIDSVVNKSKSVSVFQRDRYNSTDVPTAQGYNPPTITQITLGKTENTFYRTYVFYDLLIFDAELTEAQIQWVIDNMINK